ncbi:InlB B-repeat-containing protein [Candidatus Saccharibacteria bacterium]|nr:InlB B-repeat-containing protein [Candidatus Saccharibacteria bacterium]
MKTRVRKSGLLRCAVAVLGIAGLICGGIFALNMSQARAEEERENFYALQYQLADDGSVARTLNKYTLCLESDSCELGIFNQRIWATEQLSSGSISGNVSEGVLTLTDTLPENYAVPTSLQADTQLVTDSEDLSVVAQFGASDSEIVLSFTNYENVTADYYVRLEESTVQPSFTVSYLVKHPDMIEVVNVPENSEHQANEIVTVAAAPSGTAFGETLQFVGWSSEDVEIDGSSFVMPEKDLVLTGYFVGADDVTVQRRYPNEIPEDCRDETAFVVKKYTPIDRAFSEKGSVCRSHTFDGWTPQAVEDLYDANYIYPDSQNQGIQANFTAKPSYVVKYAVVESDGLDDPEGIDLPSDSEKYYPGEEMSLAEALQAGNFIFDGWYADSALTEKIEATLTVPEITEDTIATVYGTWKRDTGKVNPSVVVEKTSADDSYLWTDEVSLKITVTNPEEFAIKDITLLPKLSTQIGDADAVDYPLDEQLENLNFAELPNGVSYNSETGALQIAELAAGESVEIPASFYVNRDLTASYELSAQITAASGEESAHKFYTLENPVDSTENANFNVNSSKDMPETIVAISSTKDSSGNSTPQSILPKIALTLISAVLVIPCIIIASRKRIRIGFRFAALGAIVLLLSFATVNLLCQTEVSYAAQQTTQSQQNLLD